MGLDPSILRTTLLISGSLWGLLSILVLIGHRRTRFPEIVLLTGIAQFTYAGIIVLNGLGINPPWYVNWGSSLMVPLGLLASTLSHVFLRPPTNGDGVD